MEFLLGGDYSGCWMLDVGCWKKPAPAHEPFLRSMQDAVYFYNILPNPVKRLPLVSCQAHGTPGMPGSYVGVGHARLFATTRIKISLQPV
jgi:hypothetical protein